MKRILLYSILTGLVLFSCQGIGEVEKPEDLIGEEKMVDILYDMALVDAAMNMSRIKLPKRDTEPKNHIFEKYNIDSAQLVESHAYYLQQLDISLRMYEEVRGRLQARKKVLDSLETHQDSLKLREKRDSLNLQNGDKKLKAFSGDKSESHKLVPFRKKDTLD